MGRTFIVVTVGVGLGALNTGNNLLYLVLGMMLSLIVVSGVLSERVLRKLTVRRIGADAAFAGEPFAFRWALSRERGAGFALQISEAHPDLEGSGALAYLPPGDEVVVRAELTARHRGPYRLGAVQVTTLFPLGLFAKSRQVELPGTLLVQPRRVPAPEGERNPGTGAAGDAGDPRRSNGTGDVLGLAPLQEGEDARRIHWRRSAALGQLVRLDREHEERRTFVLEIGDAGSPEQIDRRCEQIAARARRLLAQGHEVGLHTPDMQLRPAAGPGQERRILQALSMVGFAP